MVYNLAQRGLSALFPSHCLLCKAACAGPAELCAPCRQTLPWLGHHCRRCALPLATPRAELCGQCLQSPPPFVHCRCAFDYRFPVDSLLSGFKYHRRLAQGHLLASLWLDHCAPPARDNRPEMLVPVPLHWRRRWQRGYNQSLLLSEHWGQALGIEVADRLRRRPSPPQQGLNRSQRRRNLRGAFTLSSASGLAGRHLALVDDVVTTGTTAAAAAAILLRAGAAQVDVWCLARTPEPGR